MHLNFEGEDDLIVTEIAVRVLCLITKFRHNKKFELCFPDKFFNERFQEHVPLNKRDLLIDLDFYAYEKRVNDLVKKDICVITTHFYKHVNCLYMKRESTPCMTIFIGKEKESSIKFAIFALNNSIFPVKYWVADRKTEEELCLEIISCLIEEDSVLPEINSNENDDKITNTIIVEENV